MEENAVESLVKEALADINKANTLDEINECRNKYLSKKGSISSLMLKMKELSIEEKKSYGQIVNNARMTVENALNDKLEKAKSIELEKALANESIDITLPGINHIEGKNNPFYKVLGEIEDIFIGMGYEVHEGPEVVTDEYNFELVNIPRDHPARDMQDSFYINDNLLLRTQTSSMQPQIMRLAKGKPIKVICPGKCYRRDDDDMTHSHQFAQVEGLVIDKNINLANLKGTLELFAKEMFSKDSKVRFRSSYFPFTEPSVEVDISCFKCHGKGCPTCKGSGWIEILGAGMVHPNVLKMSGYDPEVYSGFAFGVGIDRVAMLRYGIDDIRRIYSNDIRFINQFNKKVED
ncbi:MAG: phenylalanine--tRNA ligase subunit alpha [Bacilli bacterium]|jgi:phenylalanyl-tRNA synthetase alpha chain